MLYKDVEGSVEVTWNNKVINKSLEGVLTKLTIGAVALIAATSLITSILFGVSLFGAIFQIVMSCLILGGGGWLLKDKLISMLLKGATELEEPKENSQTTTPDDNSLDDVIADSEIPVKPKEVEVKKPEPKSEPEQSEPEAKAEPAKTTAAKGKAAPTKTKKTPPKATTEKIEIEAEELKVPGGDTNGGKEAEALDAAIEKMSSESEDQNK